jgi:hypothetical protein
VLIQCCRDVMTAPLRSNVRGDDHRKHCFLLLRASAGVCLPSHCLAIKYSGFQASWHISGSGCRVNTVENPSDRKDCETTAKGIACNNRRAVFSEVNAALVATQRYGQHNCAAVNQHATINRCFLWGPGRSYITRISGRWRRVWIPPPWPCES